MWRVDRLTGLLLLAGAWLGSTQLALAQGYRNVRPRPFPELVVWYVDDDARPGPASGSRDDPFHSIQQGVEAARAGELVLVAPGTYNELVDFVSSRTSSATTSATGSSPSGPTS